MALFDDPEEALPNLVVNKCSLPLVIQKIPINAPIDEIFKEIILRYVVY